MTKILKSNKEYRTKAAFVLYDHTFQLHLHYLGNFYFEMRGDLEKTTVKANQVDKDMRLFQVLFRL